MMQILLTVIGLAMAAGAGYALILNYSTQTISSEVASTTERLDLAAAAVARMAKVIPGTDVLSPPVETYDPSVGYATMPAGSGPFNSRVDGVPFLYCPVGRLSDAQVAQLSGTVERTLQQPSTSGTERVYGKLVVQSDWSAAIGSDVRSQFDPIGILIAPERGRSLPPSCSNIQVRDGRVIVTNGIVRVVSNTRGLARSQSDMSTIYVSADGRGGRTAPDDRASINSALLHFAVYQPDQLTISVADYVTVGGSAWSQFTAAAANSSGNLAIVGEGSGGATMNAPAGTPFHAPAKLSLRNIAFAGPQIVVNSGDEMFLTDQIVLYSNAQAAIWVQKGGQIHGQAGLLAFENGGRYAFKVDGKARFEGINIVPINASPNGIFMIEGGDLSFKNMMVGSDGSLPLVRSQVAPFYVIGSATMVSDPDVDARGTSGGTCHYSADGNTIMKWVSQSKLRVPDEDTYAVPSVDDNAALRNAYEAERQERNVARQHVYTYIDCV